VLTIGGLFAVATAALHARHLRRIVLQPLTHMVDAMRLVESGDHMPRVDVTERGVMGEAQTSLNAMLEALHTRVVSRVEHERVVSNLVAEHECAARAERVSAAEELAAGVATDLDERVTSAVGFAEMARRKAGSPSMERDLGALIEQLTEVGRVMRGLTGRTKPDMPLVRLDALAADVADTARQHVWPRIEVSLRVAEGEHVVKADGARLRQAVLNLVSNSRAAMPGGGQLTIEVGRLQSAGASDGPLELGALADSLVLRVRDTGRGIPQAKLSRLFEPFDATRDEGAGLGLAQVAGIMAQLGGGVRVESQEGLGTTVSLLFPRAPQNAEPAIEHEAIGDLAVAS
jgi:signal transduction histidine kinase